MKMRPKAEDKKKGARRGKRKRITSKRKIGRKRIYSKAKRARATKSREEGQTHEYFEEKRNLEDLWKTAFPVGIEWGLFDDLNL
ncbi:unnamed protein product [Arabis nemorensis]|uniref:Uncharacterized protein n=1 Tax=Arabis nemorensis TaxID=586526 RepID=A0A565CQY2_9BRAS|nr:unnamed protein product [Arabis nemorensis]